MNGIELKLSVIPNSKEFGVLGFDEWKKAFKVKVKSKPLNGKANQEIEKKLSEFFGEQIQIISGKHSREKKIFIPNKKLDEVLKLLKQKN